MALDNAMGPHPGVTRELLTRCQFIVTGTTSLVRNQRWEQHKQVLLEEAKALLNVEVVAVFSTREGVATIDCSVGYEKADGAPIPEDELRRELTYKLTPESQWGKEAYDGITGYVASRGLEFVADSLREVQAHISYRGKPTRLGIWNDQRPFCNMLAVPLVRRGQTIGVLRVENKAVNGSSRSPTGRAQPSGVGRVNPWRLD